MVMEVEENASVRTELVDNKALNSVQLTLVMLLSNLMVKLFLFCIRLASLPIIVTLVYVKGFFIKIVKEHKIGPQILNSR